ncbi:MAG: BPSL0067 family protein [Phormidium sp.]
MIAYAEPYIEPEIVDDLELIDEEIPFEDDLDLPDELIEKPVDNESIDETVVADKSEVDDESIDETVVADKSEVDEDEVEETVVADKSEVDDDEVEETVVADSPIDEKEIIFSSPADKSSTTEDVVSDELVDDRILEEVDSLLAKDEVTEVADSQDAVKVESSDVEDTVTKDKIEEVVSREENAIASPTITTTQTETEVAEIKPSVTVSNSSSTVVEKVSVENASTSAPTSGITETKNSVALAETKVDSSAVTTIETGNGGTQENVTKSDVVIAENKIASNSPITSTTETTSAVSVTETQNPAVSAKPPIQFEFPKENQPLVGIIDKGFSANNPDIDYSRIILGQDRVDGDPNPLVVAGEGNTSGTSTLGIIGATQNNQIGINGINDDAPLWVGRAEVNSDQWAESLMEFVDSAKTSKQPNAVVNLSFNLTNLDGTPRFELTGAERAALAYAQHNNVLIVASAGDNPGQISALGKAGLEFDNIITVGAAERVNNAVALSKAYAHADYSGSGAGLDIVADGGSAENPITVTSGEGTAKEFGTSVATAKVTGAVSQVWAANSKLNFTQVIDILKRTATDLGKPNWDADTGAGLLNMAAAVTLAKATQPELLPIEPPKDDEPEVQEPVIKITPEMGFLPEPIKLTDDIWFLGGPSPDKLNLIGGFSNRNAADTTNADQLWSGGGLGLNLNGSGVTVGVWDEAKVRNTHQEFGSRVVISDAASKFSDHATHVAGTIGATGVNSEARGMANQVNIRSYDWNNYFQELEAAAKTGLTLSNHSYGSIIGWSSGIDWSGIGVSGSIDSWFGDRARFSEAEGFGKYGQGSNELDRILYNNPNLLSVWASGNDRGASFANQSGNNTYISYFSSNPGNIPNWQGQGWYRIPNSGMTTAPGKDGGNTGYDTLSADGAIAKNTLVVGAINAITADPYNNSNVVMSSFSNWGPTDDGRLKVDVVGDGVGVYSTLASSNTAYASYSGTSMATPNVTGTAALLTQHYKNLYGASPRSATLKGVITHTAFDAGNKGPDYTYGWGVVDGAAAATFLTNAKNQVSDRLIESTYTGSQQSYQITSNGSGSLKATLVWTDPPGNAHGNGLDEKTRVLVNDLDLSITAPNGQVFYPWTLDPNNPSAPAVRTTRNHVDNIEQVLIDTPMPGTYTINVNHSGNSFTQAYSLLVSGISKPLENPIGRGSRAPNLFIDAYNRVNGQGRSLKAQGDAYRWGNGWTQRFLDSNNNEVLIMLEDGQSKAYVVWGEILKEYKNVGGPVGANLPGGGWAYLGYPRSDEKGGTSSKGSPLAIQEFAGENGKARLYYHWNNGNRVATWGSIGAFYINIGGHNHWLGAPTKREYIDGDTIFADFEGGRIGFRISDGKAEALQPGQQPSWRQKPSWEIAIDNEANQMKWLLGEPTTGYWTATTSPYGTTGKGRNYEHGTVHWSPQYGAVAVWYDLQREYEEYGSPNGSGGWLGFPTKREYPWNGGMRTDFEGGYIFWNGQRAKAYRPWESPTAVTNSNNITFVNFSGTVGPSIGVNLRNSPRFSDRSSRNEPNGKRLEFDAWTYGEVGTDMWTGQSDARWFKVKGTNLWVPSAYINGNPPNSSPMPGGGTTPLPPSNTKLTQLLNGQLTGRYIDVDGYYGAQCWDLVAYVTGQTGLTTNWQRGTNVMSSGNIPIGTAIATFLGPNGSYDTPSAANQHTGIFAGYGTQNGVSGFYIWDQNWSSGPVQKHFIRTGGSGTSNASNYHVIRF